MENRAGLPLWSASSQSAELAADVEELLPPLLANTVGIEIAEVVEGFGDGIARGRNHGGGIAVGAAGGLLEDLIDHAEPQHVLGRDLHAVGDFLRLGAVAPQDRGGSLRRDHAVD